MIFAKDHSGPRAAYFLDLQKALKRAGYCQPVLVIDRARLRANLAQVMDDLPAGMALRCVAKSLPVRDILNDVLHVSGSQRLMSFNLPMMLDLAADFPQADQLCGKPFPVAAAAQALSELPKAQSDRIHWLIDSQSRLTQYEALARARAQTLNVVFELDIGLHRGGFASLDRLRPALEHVQKSEHLRFSGLMGYEAHLAKVPTRFGLRRAAQKRAMQAYRAAIALAEEVFGPDPDGKRLRNAGGSPTFRIYENTQIANEVSVGSVLVKPTDFDTDLLTHYSPAAFIATPALKVGGPMQTPFLEVLDRVKAALDPNVRRSVFLHGGYWKARPEDPPGLRINALYGRSSNQELLTAGPRLDLAEDDFVFLRPRQAEAVLMQFGKIAVYEDGEIVDQWRPYDISA